MVSFKLLGSAIERIITTCARVKHEGKYGHLRIALNAPHVLSDTAVCRLCAGKR